MGKPGKRTFQTYIKKDDESKDNLPENHGKFENNEVLNRPFSINELRKTISDFKTKKATGYDTINNEFLKLSTDRILNLILDFLNLAISKSLITSNWCLDIISPLHKDGPKDNPDNYRGICVMNSLLKVLCTMMNNRLTEYCENTNLINEGQIGFKKGCRTSDHLLTLKSIVNKYVYDHKQKIYTCFVDSKKAFDSIWQREHFYKKNTLLAGQRKFLL